MKIRVVDYDAVKALGERAAKEHEELFFLLKKLEVSLSDFTYAVLVDFGLDETKIETRGKKLADELNKLPKLVNGYFRTAHRLTQAKKGEK